MPLPVPSSAVAGYLSPVNPPAAPLYGDALDDIFHDTLQGILGIADGSLIRPRWQPDPPNQPAFNVDWVAFGITMVKGDWNVYQTHDSENPAGYGSNLLERDEVLHVLHSFYGPNSAALQSRYHDGLQVEQNRVLLQNNYIKVIDQLEVAVLPALLEERWVHRVDQRVIFRRRVYRKYSVLNLVGAQGTINNETYIQPFIVPPTP